MAVRVRGLPANHSAALSSWPGPVGTAGAWPA